MSRYDRTEDSVRNAASLARAMIRLPWTLGLWGAQQAAGLLDPRRPWSQSAASLDEISNAAQQPLEGPLQNLQRAGDHLQSGWIDAAVGLATGSWREPRAAFDEAWGVLGRSWDRLAGQEGTKR